MMPGRRPSVRHHQSFSGRTSARSRLSFRSVRLPGTRGPGTRGPGTQWRCQSITARCGSSAGPTPRWAAMIYQHATRDREQAIVRALGTFVRDVRNAAADNQPDTGEREEEEA